MTRGLVLLCCIASLVPSTVTDRVIASETPPCQAVALTFDMCPVRAGSGLDEPLIALLVERRIPATFFLSGTWMARHDQAVKDLLNVPFFEVGTHGQVHAHLPALDEAHQRAEITGAIGMLERQYGRRSLLFRPPYGEYDETTGRIVQALGLRLILWNVVSGDPDPNLSKERMLQVLHATVRGGSVIVFHANGKGRYTRDVVDELTQDFMERKGLRPVTVTEMSGKCATSSEHH
jgi:peptidoglycan/xylan/chitin deacetylase (PgdA/CDA1 family)